MRESNPINVTLIDHVVIRVRDMGKMLTFYEQVLGFRLERGPDDEGLAQLRAGLSLLDLVDAFGPLGREVGAAPDHEAPNMDHVCFRVEPWDAELIVNHLRRRGVASGDVMNNYGSSGFGPSIYLKDPEGNVIELKGRHG